MDEAGPVYLVGPTGVGKTATALALAERVALEVVSADSMQVYRGLDILSAKPTPGEQARVPHHLIDVLDVTEPFSAAEFKRLAEQAIADIHARGRRALVVGGTGLYVKALADGLFDGPEASSGIRQRLLDEAESTGVEALHSRLAAVDPRAAKKIDSGDLRRIVRALEVYETTGRPMSAQQTEWAEAKACLMFGLRLPRETLYARINARVDQMFRAGVVAEVEWLVAGGIQQSPTAMQAIGVREIIAYLRGVRSLDETKRRIKTQTRRYAKRQLTWFRKDPRITWYDVAADGSHVAALAEAISE